MKTQLVTSVAGLFLALAAGCGPISMAGRDGLESVGLGEQSPVHQPRKGSDVNAEGHRSGLEEPGKAAPPPLMSDEQMCEFFLEAARYNHALAASAQEQSAYHTSLIVSAENPRLAAMYMDMAATEARLAVDFQKASEDFAAMAVAECAALQDASHGGHDSENAFGQEHNKQMSEAEKKLVEYLSSPEYQERVKEARKLLEEIKKAYEQGGEPSKKYKELVKQLGGVEKLVEHTNRLIEALSPETSEARREELLKGYSWKSAKAVMEKVLGISNVYIKAMEVGWGIGTPIGKHFADHIETFANNEARTRAVIGLQAIAGEQFPSRDVFYDYSGQTYYYKASDKSFYVSRKVPPYGGSWFNPQNWFSSGINKWEKLVGE